MGKPEDDGNLRRAGEEALGDSTERNGARRRCGCGCFEWISGFVGCKCVFVMLLSVSLFLSALFLLLPFAAVDREDSYLDHRFKGHAVVASFSLNRPKAFLNANLSRLQDDIFQEMSYISINVTILALESHGPNITNVVFGIDHDTAYREILPLSLSTIKGMFESVLINQSTLQLTKPLFGETFLFEVLKFPGGITVIPPQSAFPLQKFKLSFNFTLNYSIRQIQINFNTLATQLKNGLNLAPYENLYVSLSNSEGSTVSPPTTVHSSVLLRVGTSNPSPRLKQLTDTITGSRSRNLGLNNTIFGKVKQVRLSSLPNNSNSSSNSPSPSPSPHSNHHHHHHHHHHNHHHHHHHHHHQLSPNMAPDIPPVASPVPQKSPRTRRAPSAPPPCTSGNRRGQRVHFRDKHLHFSSTPTPAPSTSPHYSAQPPHASHPPPRYSSRPPHASHHSPRYSARPPHASHHPPRYSARPPHHQLHSPTPIPAAKPHYIVPVSAPLPHVVFAHQAQPPKAKPSEQQHANEVDHPQPQSSSSNLNLPAIPWIVLVMLIATWLRE